MSTKPHDMTPVVDLTYEKGTGPIRARRPIFVDLLPPCNHACPAGENIQAWLALAQAGKYREAWETLVADNPMPAVHGRVCYHPCEERLQSRRARCGGQHPRRRALPGRSRRRRRAGRSGSRRRRAANACSSSAPVRAGCRPPITSRAWGTRSRFTRRGRCPAA